MSTNDYRLKLKVVLRNFLILNLTVLTSKTSTANNKLDDKTVYELIWAYNRLLKLI